MNNLPRVIQVAAATLVGIFAATAHAQDLNTKLCSTVTIDVGASLGVDIPVGIEAAAGAGWAVAFEGNAKGAIEAGITPQAYIAPGGELFVQTCVESVDLLNMYHAGLLKPDQIEPTLLYLGDTISGFDPANGTESGSDVSKEVFAGLVNAATLSQMQAFRTTSIYQPATLMIDSAMSAALGELSPLNALDESVGVMNAMVDNLPVDPRLTSYVHQLDDVLSEQVASLLNSSDMVCAVLEQEIDSPATAALTDLCNDLSSLATNTAELQNVVQSVLGIVGDVGDTIGDTAVVFDGVVVATEAVDGALSDSVGFLGDSVSAVGNTTRKVVGMTDTINGSVGTLTESLDDIASVTNGVIADVMNTVAAPVRVLADAGSVALDGVVNSLQSINNTLESLVGDIRE